MPTVPGNSVRGPQGRAVVQNIIRRGLAALFAGGLLLAIPRLVEAQTVSDVLSFLLTNRSVSSDFVRDEQAAAATRDTISQLLVTELGALPISSSSGGFVYRLNPEIGISVRSSDSFGPFFSERTLTAGRHSFSFAVSYQQSNFHEIDGRDLRDGTLVANAARLRGEAQPFDVETLTLRLRADTLTLIGNLGLSDRLDVGVALPLVRLELSGTRIDNYRGTSLPQAVASGSTVGPGDLILHAKYNLLRAEASGLAIGAEARLPTGNRENLLGTGDATVTPRFVASWESGRAGLHGNLGSTFGGRSKALEYGGAVTLAATPRLTFVVEALGRRLSAIGRLVDVTAPHPQVANVETIRLSTTEEAANRLTAVAGLKWNVAASSLLSVNVLRPLTQAGLNRSWTPTLTWDYSFGQ